MTERWHYTENTLGIVKDAAGKIVAVVYGSEAEQPSPDMHDRARLIALAPGLAAENARLREALEDVVNGLGCQPGYVNELALRKARAALEGK